MPHIVFLKPPVLPSVDARLLAQFVGLRVPISDFPKIAYLSGNDYSNEVPSEASLFLARVKKDSYCVLLIDLIQACKEAGGKDMLQKWFENGQLMDTMFIHSSLVTYKA
jgi:hypothetical protein